MCTLSTFLSRESAVFSLTGGRQTTPASLPSPGDAESARAAGPRRWVGPRGGCALRGVRTVESRISFCQISIQSTINHCTTVNHCTSKEISMEIKRYLLVQWLTESRFGKTKFGIPIEKRSLMRGCQEKDISGPNFGISRY